MIKISAPNVHLFAFHLRNATTTGYDRVVPNAELLWLKCDEIFEKLTINQKLHIKGYYQKKANEIKEGERPYIYAPTQEPIGNRVNLYQEKSATVELQGKVKVKDSSHPESWDIRGLVYPSRLYDSYALTFNIGIPENQAKVDPDKYNSDRQDAVPISIFREFNPDNCFLPEFIGSSLGQTLLLTAWLENEQNQLNLRKIADECLAEFIPDVHRRPKFNAKGKLFGSPIFEYGQIPDDADLLSQPPQYCHIIIWVFCKEETAQKFEFCYGDLPELFLFRNKVITTFKNTRWQYQTGYTRYQEIDAHIKKIDSVFGDLPETGEINEPNLRMLKDRLKTMPKLYLTFSQALRNLEHDSNTIAINTKNYTEVLEEIRTKLEANLEYLPHIDLSFLEIFSKKDFPYLQERIQADLGYFVHGSSLVDKAIASIRGMVEIEQAERNTKLQITVFAVGIGVGAGSIFATSYSLFSQEPRLHLNLPIITPILQQINPAIQSISYSLIFGILAGVIAYKIAHWVFKTRQEKKS